MRRAALRCYRAQRLRVQEVVVAVHAGGLDRRIDPVRRVGRMAAAVAGVATAEVQLDARFAVIQPEVQAALAIKLHGARAGVELGAGRARKAAQLRHRRLVPQGERHPQVRARRHHHIADAADQVPDLLAAPLDPSGLAVEIQVLVALGESLRRLRVHGHGDAGFLLEQSHRIVVVTGVERGEPQDGRVPEVERDALERRERRVALRDFLGQADDRLLHRAGAAD